VRWISFTFTCGKKTEMTHDAKIIIYGAGAIGCTLAAWLSVKHENTFLLCRGESAKQIRNNGLKIYCPDNQSEVKTIPVKVIESIDEVEKPDVIALAVKNYSLPEIVKNLKGKIGNETVVLGLQNGVSNEKALSHFSKTNHVIFGILAYNAWMDESGVVGYQHKGVMVIGSAEKKQNETLKSVAAVFNKGIETFIAKDWRNVAHTKLLINLGNSITTLLGVNFKDTSRTDLLQKITSNMMLEGMNILKAEGIKEEKIKGLPSWNLLKASAVLPQFITAPLFRKNIKKMGMSSMAQDIFKRQTGYTELDDINGYMISLADKQGIAAPCNRAVYRLCKEKFVQKNFTKMDVEKVWQTIAS